jgi:hypothetical protein
MKSNFFESKYFNFDVKKKIVFTLILAFIFPLYVEAPTANADNCSPTQTRNGSSVILSFTSVTTCDWTVPAGITSIRYLIVGGGGSGGSGRGGGGGAGGLLRGNATVTANQTLSIKVGAGGTGSLTAGSNTNGDTSTISGTGISLIAPGGGRGGSHRQAFVTDDVVESGSNGGSGGGGSINYTSYTNRGGTAAGGSVNGNAGAGSTTNACASRSTNTDQNRNTGGGGGAGSAGVIGCNTTSGVAGGTAPNGGNGLADTITGTSVTYATGGGGTGGKSYDGTTCEASYFTSGAGSGGSNNVNGGRGQACTAASSTLNGTANRGAGGGGTTSVAGGNGGSGVVIISYVSTTALGSISSNEAFAVYMDAPNVQGSYVAREFPNSTWTDTYDTITTTGDPCPSNGNVGSYSFASGQCKIFTSAQNSGTYKFGGALTTSETATTTGSQSPSVWVGDSAGTTITFNRSVNYLGLWWSAGSQNNALKFYQDSALVLTLSVDDVCALVRRTSTTCSKPTDTSTLTAINGATYQKSNYFGHPKNQLTWDENEPFTYLHVFARNRITFNKVIISMSGNGFEFDNLTIGDLSTEDVNSRLVAVRSYGAIHYLTYDTRGGQSIDSQTVVESGTVAVTNTVPTRSGFTFSSWNTSANGSGTSYSAGNTYPSSGTISSSTTLFAQWTFSAARCDTGTATTQTDTATGATVVIFRAAASANGTCTFVVPTGVVALDYLVVAGGGGGGSGGGGAGGLVTNRAVRNESNTATVAPRRSALAVNSSDTISVTVGSGGNGGAGGYPRYSTSPDGTAHLTQPTNGSNSVLGSIRAIGGGAGGHRQVGYENNATDSRNGTGQSGGSGGGSSFDQNNTNLVSSSSQSTVSGATSLGNSGGTSTGSGGFRGGTGGGGAGATGGTIRVCSTGSSTTTPACGGDGGDGVLVDILNTGTFSEEYACGGGGGINANSDQVTTNGGGSAGCSSSGKGSDYGNLYTNYTTNSTTTAAMATSGTAGYGGGGGGTDPEDSRGGNGGSGIVIISFLINNADCPNNGINTSTTSPLACNFTVSIRAGRDTVTVDPRANPYSYSDTPTTTSILVIGVDSITITVSNNQFTISAPGRDNPLRGGTYPALYSLTTTGTDTSSAYVNINVTDPAQHTPTRVGINPWVTSMKVPPIVFGTINAVLVCITPRASTVSGYGNIPTVTMSSVASNALRTNLANGGIKLEGTVDSITANASNFRIVKNSSDKRLLPGSADRIFDVNVSNTATGGNGSCSGGSESTLTLYRLGFSQKSSKNMPLKNGKQP